MHSRTVERQSSHSSQTVFQPFQFYSYIMSKRVKESGYQCRLKRKKREDEVAALSGSLQKYLTHQESSTAESTLELESPIELSSHEHEQPEQHSNAEIENEIENEIQSMAAGQPFSSQCESTSNKVLPPSELTNSSISFEIYDPNTWPTVLPDAMRDQIVNSGLLRSQSRKNKEYPVSKDGRSFNSNHFYSSLPNGIIYKRDWLLYSDSSDSAYCLFCSLFNRSESSFCSVGRGYSNWHNFHRDAARHERSFKHHRAFKTWLDYSKRLVSNETIDAHHQKLLNKETERWKEVMKRLICSVSCTTVACFSWSH